MEASQRAPVRGPTFIRLLTRLTDVDVPPPQTTPSDRLSQWIDWTRAVALSRALDGNPPVPDTAGAFFGSEEDAACTRMRAALANTIASGSAMADPGAPDEVSDAPAAVDYTAFHQHYLAMQRAMQTATGKLRGQLRDRLAGASAEMARLAEVDAMMEGVLSPREHKLLAGVPALLGEHFERLQQAARDNAPSAWLEAFRRDMQGVLLAELDVRFLPIDALLAALRNNPQGCHVQTLA